jgi:hypothetical protein
VRDAAFPDRRAELLEDLRLMAEVDRQNLTRRHKEAIAKDVECWFVKQLCKIPRDEREGRRPTLQWLNSLSDDEFGQMMELLDHDVLTQQWRRLWKGTREAAGTVASAFNQGATQAAPHVAELARWLREKEAKQKRTGWVMLIVILSASIVVILLALLFGSR